MSLRLDRVELPRGTLGELNLAFDTGVHLITGPNGIGKTSLLSALAGSLPLKSGRFLFSDKPLGHREALVVLAPNAPPEMPWIRSGLLLDFIASLYPASRRDAAFAAEVVARLGIGAFLASPLGTLSAGTARKLLLAATLVAAPPVMLFDEPTNDIDAGSGAAFIEFVREASETRIVIITTHHAGDLAALNPALHALG
ncbi:MAG TPA: ATP-binding cassette domain-containing protein [Povalibacter sp.]|nr:ATP-binding cassette domain-containing protein [Povalibacter sp.]